MWIARLDLVHFDAFSHKFWQRALADTTKLLENVDDVIRLDRVSRRIVEIQGQIHRQRVFPCIPGLDDFSFESSVVTHDLVKDSIRIRCCSPPFPKEQLGFDDLGLAMPCNPNHTVLRLRNREPRGVFTDVLLDGSGEVVVRIHETDVFLPGETSQ